MKKLIRVRAVDGSVVFVIDPTTGTSAKPLRSVGRDGPSASADGNGTRPFEDVPDLPIYRRAIATKDLELVANPAPQPEPEAPPAPVADPAPAADTESEKESA